MSSQYSVTVPEFISQAFDKLYMYGSTADKYEAFASRWGGIDFDTLRHVVEVGDGDDKLVALFAIGFSKVKEAADILAPLLLSANRKERWVSTLCLGYLQDERAFPALQTLILDGLSLQERIWAEEHPESPQAAEIVWMGFYRYEAIKLLEHWHDPSLVPIVHQAFLWIWEIQRTLPRSIFEGGAFDELAYTLGLYEDLTVLDGLDLPPAHKKVALVYLSLGVLHAETLVDSDLVRAMISNEELQKQVAQVLGLRFGLSVKEQEDCVEHFYHNMQTRNEYGMEASINEVDASSLQVEEEEGEEEDTTFTINPAPLSIYRGHKESIHSLSWSPDGTHLVSGSADLTAQVWDAATGKHLVTFPTHFASVNVVAWSPRGDLIASGGNDNCVYVWNAFTGKQVMAYYGHSSWICQGLGWSPDGRLLASASWDHTVQVWEALTGKTLLTYRGHQGVVVSLAWSPDGTRIATGGGYPEATAHVWDVQTGNLICSYRGHSQTGDTAQEEFESVDSHEAGSVRSLAWSPDGTRIVSTSTGSYWICRVWDAANGKELLIRDQQTWGPVVWAPDGTSVISPGRYVSTVDQWNPITNKIMVNYAPETLRTIEALAWSADSKRIAASDALNNVVVWEAHQSS